MILINPATRWFEFKEVPTIDQSSAIISQIFNDVWLSRYPSLRKVILENGSEFKRNLILFLKYFSIKPKCTAIKNPQANAILEIIHQVFGSMLKTKDLANVMFDVVAPWSEILASIVYAVRCSYNSTLQATPGKLVFGRDMLLEINLQLNYREICPRKQKLINFNNKRENAK